MFGGVMSKNTGLIYGSTHQPKVEASYLLRPN